MSVNPRGPLSGKRVLDLTSIVLGPMATQILADYGADVIKVESLSGDPMRANGVSRHAGMSSIYLTLNRNKRSLALDLKNPKGRELVKKLVRSCDVLVHNMRPDAMKRLGLDYESVEQINPNIVYCVATGYGEQGLYGGRPVFDDIVQAASGLVGLVEDLSGKKEYVPTLVADKVAGIYTANAVLAAMVHQERTGEGQYVEVPMFESLVSFVLVEHQGGQVFDPPQGDMGYKRLTSGGRRPTVTKDGAVIALPYSGEHWATFFREAGRADLLDKYDLMDSRERNARIKELYEDLAECAIRLTSDECIRICEANDIPSTRIYKLEELMNHPHLQSVGYFESCEHPTEGTLKQPRPSALFRKTPAGLHSHAPAIGENSLEVLQEIGVTFEEIDALKREKILS